MFCNSFEIRAVYLSCYLDTHNMIVLFDRIFYCSFLYVMDYI